MNLQRVEPFYERHEFTGQFILDDTETESVEVVVEFNELESGPIKGVIRNRGSAVDVARRVCDSHGPCRLVSVADEHPKLEVDDVFVTELSMDKSPRAPDVAAELSCGIVSETWRRKADTERELTFRLAGGLGILQPQEASTSRWTGERQIEQTNSILDLGIPWPGTIELRNEYLWEQHGRRGRFASVPTLYLKCHASERELSDAKLLEDAKALADDATLLMSFVRRHWVTWYQYTFCTPQAAYRHRIESSRDVRGQRDRISDSPVGRNAAEFIRVGLPRLRKLRDNGKDLRLPIAHSIPEAGARYVEERFARAFWGLEKLVAVLVQPQKPSPTVAQKSEAVADKLQRLCDSLDVTWRDLYPAQNKEWKKPKFILTRNKVFHSHRSVDSDLVWRETERIALLFERLVLKTLGWSELGNTTAQAIGIPIDKIV